MTHDPQFYHQQIRNTRVAPSEHDYIVYTDGSGHKDGYGVGAGLIVCQQPRTREFYQPYWVAFNETGVHATERGEFEALLHGLLLICNQRKALKREGKPTLAWICDRQNLVLSVWRDPKTKEPINARNTQPDLWPRFEYFEKKFNITPFHVSHGDVLQQDVTDALASHMRTPWKTLCQALHQRMLREGALFLRKK